MQSLRHARLAFPGHRSAFRATIRRGTEVVATDSANTLSRRFAYCTDDVTDANRQQQQCEEWNPGESEQDQPHRNIVAHADTEHRLTRTGIERRLVVQNEQPDDGISKNGHRQPEGEPLEHSPLHDGISLTEMRGVRCCQLPVVSRQLTTFAAAASGLKGPPIRRPSWVCSANFFWRLLRIAPEITPITRALRNFVHVYAARRDRRVFENLERRALGCSLTAMPEAAEDVTRGHGSECVAERFMEKVDGSGRKGAQQPFYF